MKKFGFFRKVVRRKHLLSKKKRTWQNSLSLQSCILTNYLWSNVLWTDEAKWIILAIMYSSKKQAHYIRIQSSYCQAQCWQSDDLELCSHWVHHELLCIPNYSKVKCEATCPKTKAWLKLGQETGQRSQTQQQIHNRMTVKEKDQGVAVVQSKVQTSTQQKGCGWILRQLCIKGALEPEWTGTMFKEEWAKIPPQWCER